jgi:hypothetical protein
MTPKNNATEMALRITVLSLNRFRAEQEIAAQMYRKMAPEKVRNAMPVIPRDNIWR